MEVYGYHQATIFNPIGCQLLVVDRCTFSCGIFQFRKICLVINIKDSNFIVDKSTFLTLSSGP